MAEEYKAYLHVRELKTRKCVKCVGLKNISKNHVERVMSGMLINMNTNDYFVDDSDVDRARAENKAEAYIL